MIAALIRRALLRATRPLAERPRPRLVLSILADGELPGLEIVKRSGGKLGRGTVYVLLDRMEDDGLIRSQVDPEANQAVVALGGLPSRRYWLKEQG